MRELANVLERAVILCAAPILEQEHLGTLATASHASEGKAYRSEGATPLADLEKQAVTDALRRANGNKSRAAALLGVSRMQLYTRLKRFGLGGPRADS